MNFFSWLTEKKDEIPKSRPVMERKDKNNSQNNDNNVPVSSTNILIETIITSPEKKELETVVIPSEMKEPEIISPNVTEVVIPSFYSENYFRECSHCRHLSLGEETENEYVCIGCRNRNETIPSQECSKCKESFVVSEITNDYICEPCKINDEWKDDWQDELSNDKLEYDKSPDKCSVPSPPPRPKPYFPKRLTNVNISRKLFNTPVKEPAKIDVIDWNKVTKNWINLYEDCKLDIEINQFTQTLQSDLNIWSEKQNEDSVDRWGSPLLGRNIWDIENQIGSNKIVWPDERPCEDFENFLDPWRFSLDSQKDWSIERCYSFPERVKNEIEKNETSSEEYFFPKIKQTMNGDIERLICEIESIPPKYQNTLSVSEELSSDTDDYTENSDQNPEGTLELILGPMYSGKSTAALLKLAQMADIGFDVLYINHSDDVRTTEAQDEVVSTHNSQYTSLSKKINSVKISELKNVNVRNYQYIGVDEGQFFPDLYENVLKWVSVYGKNVIVASLDGDAYRRKFGQVLDLVPNADSVTKLKAYCDICRKNEKKIKPAPFTARLVGGTEAKIVGGRDLYLAMCRECHNRHLTETGL